MEPLPPVSWKCLFWFLASSQFPSDCPFTLQSSFISNSVGTLFADRISTETMSLIAFLCFQLERKFN